MKVRWTGGVRRLAMAALAAAVLVPGAAHAQGKITGKVALSGAAPAAAKLKMDADPVCAAAHPDGATAEDIVDGVTVMTTASSTVVATPQPNPSAAINAA